MYGGGGGAIYTTPIVKLLQFPVLVSEIYCHLLLSFTLSELIPES